jgi:hypothetical protein
MTTSASPAQLTLTLIRAHQYLYYVLVRPVITDYEYDMLCSAAGVEGGGGSDLASSYTLEEKELATQLLARWTVS